VPRARHLVRDLLGRRRLHPADRSGVLLSVSEAFTNAVVHAYPHGGGDIDLSARIEHSLLRVSIRDYGVGTDAPSSHPSQGYGMLLIKAHVVDLTVCDCDPGTEVTMTFDLAVR
jgi:anti-sigma regulatory factor (Ser/Thr protein kinase)